jgi:hypothetical protein
VEFRTSQRNFLKEFKNNKLLKVADTDKNQEPTLMTKKQYVNWLATQFTDKCYSRNSERNKKEILRMCRDKILGFYQIVRRTMGKNNDL